MEFSTCWLSPRTFIRSHMRDLIELLHRLGFLHLSSRDGGEEEMVAGVRSLLGDRCPICGGCLEGHRFGSFACFKVDGVDVRDRKDALRRCWTKVPTASLPAIALGPTRLFALAALAPTLGWNQRALSRPAKS